MWARIRKHKKAICVSLAVGSLVALATVGTLFAAKPPPAPKYSITFLGTLGGSWSSATSINNNGDVVGLAARADGTSGPFVYTAADGMRDLNRLIPNTGLDAPTVIIIGPDISGDAASDLYVAGGLSDDVRIFDGVTGQALGAFVAPGSGGLDNAHGIAFGPDGHFYVSSSITDQVLKYNGATGAYLGVFVATGSGGLDQPLNLIFGPDDDGDGLEELYVTSRLTHEVLVYNGMTGAFLHTLFPPDATVLGGPIGLDFGPDGALYISGLDTHNVVRWDFTTETLTAFVTAGSGGLSGPRDLAFGPDGKLYVNSGDTDEVLRYDGGTAAFIDVFVTAGSGGLNVPRGIAFHSGNLLVTSRDTDQILVYQGPAGGNPGAFIDTFVPGTGWVLQSALDINDAGQIVGEASLPGGPTRGYRCTRAPAGTPWTLEIIEPPAGAQTSHAVGINGMGDVTGHIRYLNSDRAFIWTQTTGTTELPAPTFQSFPFIKGKSINNSLEVAASGGNSNPRALRWDPTTGAWENLGVLSGGGASGASGINGNGQVSGFSNTKTSTSRAVRYTDGAGLKDLGTLGGQQSDATGINSLGEVVGWADLRNGARHLFLYKDGSGMIDLEKTIVNQPAGLSGRLSAGKINDSGQVCGTADDGTLEAFILTPQ